MTFDLVVTISMNFYEWCQKKRDVCPPEGKGYSDMFICLRYFGGLKILNFNIFWGFQKTEYFWGYEDFVDIF